MPPFHIHFVKRCAATHQRAEGALSDLTCVAAPLNLAQSKRVHLDSTKAPAIQMSLFQSLRVCCVIRAVFTLYCTSKQASMEASEPPFWDIHFYPLPWM